MDTSSLNKHHLVFCIGMHGAGSVTIIPENSYLFDCSSLFYGFVLTDPILLKILQYTIDEDKKYYEVSMVSKQWNGVGKDNSIWKLLAFKIRPMLRQTVKLRNWFKICHNDWKLKNRKQQIVEKKGSFPQLLPMIENCDFDFECPKKWSNLTLVDDGIKHCSHCDQHVYYVNSYDQFVDHVLEGHCLALDNRLYMNGLKLKVALLMNNMDYETMVMSHFKNDIVNINKKPFFNSYTLFRKVKFVSCEEYLQIEMNVHMTLCGRREMLSLTIDAMNQSLQDAQLFIGCLSAKSLDYHIFDYSILSKIPKEINWKAIFDMEGGADHWKNVFQDFELFNYNETFMEVVEQGINKTTKFDRKGRTKVGGICII